MHPTHAQTTDCAIYYDPHIDKKSLLSLVELQKKPVEGFSAGLKDDSDVFKWEVLIIGPQDTL